MDRLTKGVVVDSAEVATWNALIEGHYDRPSAWISNLLCFHHGVCRPPLTGGQGGDPKTLPRSETTPGPSSAHQFNLHPNPTQNWVAVTYVLAEGHGAQAHVQVRDGLGRTMETRSLPGSEGQVVLDTRPWAKGPFTVVFTLEGVVVHSTKLIVQ